MSRKDIFYSGSVTNLKEYQSQKSLTDYRNSVVSLTRFEKEHRNDVARYQDVESSQSDPCPCLPPAFKAALSSMLDVSLLKDPAFMLIGISNLFGMAALYIPFFYLVDAATKNVSCRATASERDLITFIFFTGNWKRKCVILGVNHRHHQHICAYFVRLCGGLSASWFTFPQQLLPGVVYDLGGIDTVLCLLHELCHYGFLLWTRDWWGFNWRDNWAILINFKFHS